MWRRPPESNQVLEILHLRQRLVRQRTQVYNRLQGMAHNAGLPKGRMKTAVFQALIKSVELDEAGEIGRTLLFELLERLNEQIAKLEEWLKKKAASDKPVQLLMTQKGVGYLTSLATVHTLGDVSRFKNTAKQTASFAGLDPLERSSAGKTRFGRISKAGSPLLRYQLGQAAQIASRLDLRLKSFHKRLGKKKPKAVAKTATARKLLVKLSIMLRDNITADEFDPSVGVAPTRPSRGRTVGNARVAPGSEMTVL